MDKKFIRATIHTTTQGVEALSAVLPAHGIGSYCVEDPADLDFILASKAGPIWDFADPAPGDGAEKDGAEARVTFWLEESAEWTNAAIDGLRQLLLGLKGDEQYGFYGADADFGRLWLDTETVSDDWKDRYKENFRAFSPCEGIVVAPPWDTEAAPKRDGESKRDAAQPIKIVIDPGMAFGTGSHETTAMCLSKLKTLLKPGDSVLDAGAGSGILAIAAALLGAGEVHAVEIDADAAESAARNIEANNVSDTISLITGDIAAEGVLPSGARYDLIAANLTCSILGTLLPLLMGALKDEGAMILSGLLDVQEERMLETLENEGLLTTEIARCGEWLMLEARKCEG